MAKATAKFNIYQHVTDTILAQLEAGTVPWHQPWSGGVHLALPRRVTGEAYQGVNVVMLWCAALARGIHRDHLDDLSAIARDWRAGAQGGKILNRRQVWPDAQGGRARSDHRCA